MINRHYTNTESGKFLLKLYYSTHKSGVQEILYKSNLDNIAFIISEILDYSPNGTTPAKILGLPLKLLRIINASPDLLHYLFTPTSREIVNLAYTKYASTIKSAPKKYQFDYLIDCSQGKLPYYATIFRRLQDCDNNRIYSLFLKYIELKLALGEYNPYKKVPDTYDMPEAVEYMMTIRRKLIAMPLIDYALKKHKKDYSFEDETYRVICPTSCVEFIAESVAMHSCLLASYLDLATTGATTIVFVRKKSDITTPYLTIEISDNKLQQAKRKYNAHPDYNDLLFIDAFCRKYNILYNPNDIITSLDDFAADDDFPLLFEYLDSWE